MWNEFTRLHSAMLKIARADPVCHRLTSAPGVGARLGEAALGERLPKGGTQAISGTQPKTRRLREPRSISASAISGLVL